MENINDSSFVNYDPSNLARTTVCPESQLLEAAGGMMERTLDDSFAFSYSHLASYCSGSSSSSFGRSASFTESFLSSGFDSQLYSSCDIDTKIDVEIEEDALLESLHLSLHQVRFGPLTIREYEIVCTSPGRCTLSLGWKHAPDRVYPATPHIHKGESTQRLSLPQRRIRLAIVQGLDSCELPLAKEI